MKRFDVKQKEEERIARSKQSLLKGEHQIIFSK